MTIEGFNQAQQAAPAMNTENNSGGGQGISVPAEIANHFNWGAFFWSWIWGICNKTYITLLIFVASLLTFIPFVGALIPLGCSIWFGIKGNEWAWQNRKFGSVQHFHEHQKKWAITGLIFFIISIVIGVLGGTMFALKFLTSGMN